MPASKLRKFLDDHGVKYVSIRHSPTFTAQEIAQSVHVSGRDFAKTIVVSTENGMAMVVLPAARRIVMSDLREMLLVPHVRLASEQEFRDLFPDCEVGAMPPFGHLYGLPVYVAGSLAEEDEIAFNAGTHTEVIKMSYEDFEALARPVVLDFITT
jgi:Ala-tRNA(Pro) deacylase